MRMPAKLQERIRRVLEKIAEAHSSVGAARALEIARRVPSPQTHAPAAIAHERIRRKPEECGLPCGVAKHRDGSIFIETLACAPLCASYDGRDCGFAFRIQCLKLLGETSRLKR